MSNSNADRPYLIVVDDDPLILESLTVALDDWFQVFCAKNRREARSAVRQMPTPPDCAIVDLGLPPDRHKPEHGFTVIKDILAAAPNCTLLVVSGQDSEQNARLARTMGATDFIAKPSDPATILEAFRVARQARADSGEEHGFIGNSPPARLLYERIQALADNPYPMLIQGETGTGKELAARAVHRLSRKASPFLALNCAAIPAQLFEATLFGHRRGAFTGAITDGAGYFGDADNGTLFLDEIGELGLELQPKLLRTLETGEYQRVGETAARTTSARVIAATNRDLTFDVETGRFRKDLYHRLSVLQLDVPSLRNLGEDRTLLLNHFSEDVSKRLNTKRFVLDEKAMTLWSRYHFPGNVRELRNIVIRLQSKHAATIVSEEQLRDELYIEQQFGDKNKDLLEFSVLAGQIEQMIGNYGSIDLEKSQRQWRLLCAQTALRTAAGNHMKAAGMLRVGTEELKRILELDGGG